MNLHNDHGQCIRKILMIMYDLLFLILLIFYIMNAAKLILSYSPAAPYIITSIELLNVILFVMNYHLHKKWKSMEENWSLLSSMLSYSGRFVGGFIAVGSFIYIHISCAVIMVSKQ